jgi:hypothetical protein
LEKDRTRRYETANELASDIKRYLTHEAVVARPPSRAYRLQKAFRRNRFAFVSAAVAACGLLAGLGLTIAAWRQTQMERNNAVQAGNREAAQRLKAEDAKA